MTGLRAALLLGCLGMCLALSAQRTAPLTPQDSTALRVKRTTVWAACLPGSGQIINRQAWKAPVVWGSMGYALWATMNNAQEMRASIDDLIAATDDDPTTEPTLTDAAGNLFSEGQLEERAYFTGGTGPVCFGIPHCSRTASAGRQHGGHASSFGYLGRFDPSWRHDVGRSCRSSHLEPVAPWPLTFPLPPTCHR